MQVNENMAWLNFSHMLESTSAPKILKCEEILESDLWYSDLIDWVVEIGGKQ